jgi:Gas vesicle protein G
MFILDSLMISGIRWALETALTAAEAEMNDDSVLREQLLEAEMRREMGEISDDEFSAIETDLLARIREIKERREGGSGPIDMGAQPIETTGDSRFQVEASVSGDFYDPTDAPHTTVIDSTPTVVEEIRVLDMNERSERADRAKRSTRSNRSEPRTRTTRTTRTARTSRTTRTTK